MDRSLMKQLDAWKVSRNRKPLLLSGARQTGKSWLLKEFGTTRYSSVALIDFTDNERMRTLFAGDYDIPRILSQLSIEAGVSIKAEETLIIFDEIQEVPRALTALKYFYEKAPEHHIVAAGSLLGVALHEGVSFPVGKIDSLSLYPMSFIEFLMALGKVQLAEAIESADFALLEPLFKEELVSLLRSYYYVGGMPEVVADFVLHRDFFEARRLQKNILNDYDRDLSRHIPPRILERTRLVWSSIPSQLAKENKKFVYGAVRSGGRGKDFEESIQWLVDYGTVLKSPRLSSLHTPLKSYASASAFKLFVLDVGLLGALANLDAQAVLEGSTLFTEFKGALTEQYVAQQLLAQDVELYYWASDDSRVEIDFVLDQGKEAIPLEVKAEENLKSKSLISARDRFDIPLSIRTSLSGYRDEGWLLNIPLWAIGSINPILEHVSTR